MRISLHDAGSNGAAARRVGCRMRALAGPGIALALAFQPVASAAQGLVFEDPVVLETFPVVPRPRAFMPEAVDLAGLFPTPGHQRHADCTGWAVGYALRTYYANREAGARGETAFSPSYVYHQIREAPGCEAGTKIPRALELLKRQGVASLEDFPYDAASCERQPDPDVQRKAEVNRITGWRRVGLTGLDDVKALLARGDPVVIGMAYLPAFRTFRGAGVMQAGAVGELPATGHAMVAVGFSDQKQAFKVINSWGTAWGDGGFGWISYETFARFVLEAYSVEVDGGSGSSMAEAPEGPDVERLRRSAAALRCAKVEVAPGPGGRVVLGGFVSSEPQRRDLLALAGDAAEDRLEIRPWPQCEAMLALDGLLRTPDAPTISMARGRSVQIIREGDRIGFEVRAPDYPSFLYVSYVAADGSIVHLHAPSDGRPVPPGGTLRFGTQGDGMQLVVAPPFGEEMIVALASEVPLRLGEAEDNAERAYLTALRAALAGPAAASPRPRIGAFVLPLRTAAR